MLVNVGVRLKQVIRSADTVARFGGDEFVVLFDESSRKSDIRELVKTVKNIFDEPFDIQGVEFSITASFGLEFVGDAKSDNDQIVHNSQLAMQQAKVAGKNGWTEYASEMREGVVNVIAIEGELKRALQNEEFEAYYQPIVNLSDGSLYGFEALARWIHPERGVVSPGEFIPVAEETGLIVELGAYILEDACTTLTEWRRAHPLAKDLTMAVNISAKQIGRAHV